MGPFIVIAIAVILIIAITLLFNKIISLKNNVKNEWSNIDIQLQRRFDLIPNLVETVKGYASHEEKVLTSLTELRTSWGSAKTNEEKTSLNEKLSGEIKSVFAIAENYPELKANESFVTLQSELSNTEDKIALARNAYNEAVTAYNTAIDVMPNSIVAAILGFKSEKLFEVQNEEAKNNVKVSFE